MAIPYHRSMSPSRLDVKQGTLALMILRTLDVLGPCHGYGIARRIEETSGHRLVLNYGTLYPALLKLEQEGSIKGAWSASENNRRAKVYTLTPAGRKQLARETKSWQETADSSRPFSRHPRGHHETATRISAASRWNLPPGR